MILDVYSSVGGVGRAAKSLGFDVVGIDVEDYSDRYPGLFYQGDASNKQTLFDACAEFGYTVDDIDLVWFSPPCLAYTPLSNVNASRYDWDQTPKEKYPTIPDLNVHEIAEWFDYRGIPYIIENVARCDDLHDPIEINGHAFNMGIEVRHKFETSFECPNAVEKGETVMRQGHTNKREKMAALKEVPKDWTMGEINSAIPAPYVHYLFYYAGIVNTTPELKQEKLF